LGGGISWKIFGGFLESFLRVFGGIKKFLYEWNSFGLFGTFVG
jgi:hypothetical protein